MRKYMDEGKTRLGKVRCNQCGRGLRLESGMIKEGCFHGETVFGYFSRRDGIRHSFDLCEDCYDALIRGFAVPVEETEEKELC